jgi:hypothetical protein
MFAQSYTLLPYLTNRLLFLDCANIEHILTLEGKSFVRALTESKKDSVRASKMSSPILAGVITGHLDRSCRGSHWTTDDIALPGVSYN